MDVEDYEDEEEFGDEDEAGEFIDGQFVSRWAANRYAQFDL